MCWVRVTKALEQTYDLIMLDARGHGLSERMNQPASSNDLAHDVLGAIDVLGLERPGVFGHSMGASTAAVAAAIAPQRISRLVLIDPPWLETPRTPEHNELRERNFMELVAKPLDEILAAGRNMAGAHEELINAWAESKLEVDTRIFRMLRFDPRFFDWHVIRDIVCPILLLTGDPARGGLVTPRTAQAIAEVWKQGRWVQIENVGHLVHFEQEDASIAAIRSFLAEYPLP
jgi:pimeloyl-ACP methyl ester carboxylesterase